MKNSGFLLLLLLFTLDPLFASDTINVSGEAIVVLDRSNMQILKDPSGKLTLEEVRKMKFQRPARNECIVDGRYLFSKNNHGIRWIRFIIHNSSPNKHWLMEFLDFNTQHIQFYFPDSTGNYQVTEAGFFYPFEKRSIIHKNFGFDLPYRPGPVTFYARIDPGNSTILSAEIKPYSSFIKYSVTEYYLLGLFYGIILVMGIYNLILYINIREAHYLYYLFYVICVALSGMCHDGTGFQFLWPKYPQLSDNLQVYSMFGLVLWTLFYSKWFLNTRQFTPRIDKIFTILIFTTAISFLVAEIFRPGNLIYLIPIASLPFLLIYITAIQIWRSGFKPARFFLMAFSFFFSGYLIRVLTLFNIMDTNVLTVYSYNIGVLIEMILFSIAIGDRIRALKAEKENALIEKEKAQRQTILQLQENEKLKDKVNQELEEKVAQRTQQLKEKNRELEIANEKLKVLTDVVSDWNIKLDLDNRKLKSDVKELSQARVLLKDVKYEEFSTVFPDEKACFKYLADLKWKDGYRCKKCGNSNFGKGKSLFGKRCTKCNYDESPTNDTLFHRLRFPITKAFYMVYLVSVKDKDITADELSETLSLRRETCWAFKRKILLARKNSKKQSKAEEPDGWGALALISLQK